MRKTIKYLLHNSFNLINKELTPIMKYLGRKRNIDIHGDFVRFSSLELCAAEIYGKKLIGEVAELGVYKGDFAKLINVAFPDRKLYLFDTFEGFSNKDFEVESINKYSTTDQDFSKTSVDIVLKKMKYPQNCIVKKGYFPESAKDIDEKFVFVSIDPDLYKPIYDALKFFYPKLANGGYIFVHDFNNQEYKGARQAVLDFCKEEKISFFPLSDVGGSAVVIKN